MYIKPLVDIIYLNHYISKKYNIKYQNISINWHVVKQFSYFFQKNAQNQPSIQI